MRQVIFAILVVALCLTVLHLISAQEGPPPPPKQIKIAVANIEEIYNSLDRRAEYVKRLEKENEQEELNIKMLEKERKKLSDDLEGLDANSDKYRQINEQITVISAKMKYKYDSYAQALERKINEQTLNFYKDIRDTIDKYAADNGYTFVFKSDYMPSVSSEKSSIPQQISIRPVLTYPKDVDITKDIIKIMNR